MGEDWHHKKARQYRRFMQEKAAGFAPAPLFEVSEEIEKQYMGVLDDCECEVSANDVLTLFIAAPKARPALLNGNTVVGRIEDDSASDAAQSATSWPVILKLRVLERVPKAETVILSPAIHPKGRP